MEVFNNTSIFTGYLKQLLHNFNLPKLKIYTKANAEYKAINKKESPEILESIVKDTNYPDQTRYVPYIRGNKIQEYINGEWVEVGSRQSGLAHDHFYVYGEYIKNYTKNLVIKDSVYDSYTHEYLGDYLRFQRDYNNINLMSLYNCFSNRACPKLSITGPNFSFNTADTQYKIYMIPVKLFRVYTIAIDCEQPIEICCGLYGNYQDTREKYSRLPSYTYQKIVGSKFSSPSLYTKILNLGRAENNEGLLPNADFLELSQMEKDLKLFLKIPASNTSTIVILEGDYRNWNDTIYNNPKKEVIKLKTWADSPDNFSKENIVANDFALDTTLYDLYQYINSSWVKVRNIYPKKIITGAEQNIDTTDINSLKTNYSLILDNTNYGQTIINNNEEFINYRLNNLGVKLKPTVSYLNTVSGKLYLNYLAKAKKQVNHTIINTSKEALRKNTHATLISPLQLLMANTEQQHPFADRLIEYLLDNVITSKPEEITDNIKRTQKALENNPSNKYAPIIPGEWDANMNKLLYEYMTTKVSDTSIIHDLLGYVDKDTEKWYSYWTDGANNKRVKNSLANTYLEEGE